jgi:hypothetical protein
MAIFRHPFLSRGIIKIANGAFSVSRGLVDLPEEIGESLGWTRVEPREDDALVATASRAHDRADRSVARRSRAAL